jgi:hypothetical protein
LYEFGRRKTFASRRNFFSISVLPFNNPAARPLNSVERNAAESGTLALE